MAVKTRDECKVLMPLANGKKQEMRFHSMTRVIANFPQYDTTKAVAEVKRAQPNIKQHQECKVPTMIGGEVNCLLGIKDGALSPELIHTLPSGLCQYRSKLQQHDGVSNAIVAGCHESLEFLANVAGGESSLIASLLAWKVLWMKMNSLNKIQKWRTL